MSRTRSRITATVLTICAAFSSVIATGTVDAASATPSHDDGVLLDTLVCVSKSTTTYEPPITLEPAETTRTIDQSYGPCIGTGEGAGVRSGTHYSTNRTNRSCLQLLSSATVTWTIEWNTGHTSTVRANRVSNVAGAVFTNTFTGSIVSGQFAGRSMIETMTAPATDITLCTLGLGKLTGLNSLHTLTII